MSDLFKKERDTIAAIGLLAATYVRFDPPLKSESAVSHVHGFNVHCLIVDNSDGEVLALEQNRIHADENPLQHAEQIGVRQALNRLHVKRPRPAGISVEKYYRDLLFMSPGGTPDDFVNHGCTLYNTFDPCGMCATTLLVCYMKRIAYLFEDKTFGGVYDYMRSYFKNRESLKEPLSVVDAPPGGLAGPLIEAGKLIATLRTRVVNLEAAGTPLVMTLDALRGDLADATTLLINLRPEHLVTTDAELQRNQRTLNDIKRLCNIA